MTKAESFYDFTKCVAKGMMLYSYVHVMLNPSCLDIYMKNQKESVNVWEDVITLINNSMKKDSVGLNTGLHNRMKEVATARRDWLKGVWKCKLSNEEKGKYIINFKNYSKFFSEEAINYALSKVNIIEFLTVEDCYGGMEDYAERQGYMMVGNCSKTEEVFEHGHARIITKRGTKYVIPDKYQVREKDFLTNCILYDYPYMSKYQMSVYKLEIPYEIYVKVEGAEKHFDSIYLPLICLKEKSIQKSEDRMNSYFKSFYHDKPEFLKKNLDLLQSKTFKELKKDIENN